MIITIFSICFYLFLFLDKIIHLRMINDFFSRQKYVLVRKKVDSADETNNLWQESSLSLRHNIVHIWGTPTSCQVEIYRKKHLSSDIVFSIRIIFVKGAFTYDVRCFWAFFNLPTYPNQILYYISLFSKIRCSLTYLPTQKSDVIYECSLILSH